MLSCVHNFIYFLVKQKIYCEIFLKCNHGSYAFPMRGAYHGHISLEFGGPMEKSCSEETTWYVSFSYKKYCVNKYRSKLIGSLEHFFLIDFLDIMSCLLF